MKPRFNIWPLIITFFLVITFQNLVATNATMKRVSYDEFLALLENKEITGTSDDFIELIRIMEKYAE